MRSLLLGADAAGYECVRPHNPLSLDWHDGSEAGDLMGDPVGTKRSSGGRPPRTAGRLTCRGRHRSGESHRLMGLLSDRRLERINRAMLSGRIIPYLVFVIGVITLAAALAVRVFAGGEFNSFGESVWWAAQTVTTVGYGDVIPDTPFSKVIAVLVMFFGIATVSLVTALITSAVITASQRRVAELRGDPELGALQRIEERLDALHGIERRLEAIERRLGAG
jgi:voltage-gated potassium channel